MRILFVGCVHFSHSALQRLLTVREAEVVGVVTRAASSSNADFRSLEPLAKDAGIPCVCLAAKERSLPADWIRSTRPDVVYCFGWSWLIEPEILALPPRGVLGYHPAALPRNRGRHPIIWTLALGLPQTASTFFFMDEGADSGDILDQRAVAVGPDDDAAALYGKLTATALEQIEQFTPRLAAGSHQRIPQDHAKASYWRKRSRLDGRIDWRMSARPIHNLVRALSRPYPGAHCLFGTNEVKVWKTEVLSPPDPAIADLEPGKVLESGEGRVVVKCGEGAVRLVEHGFSELPAKGAYL